MALVEALTIDDFERLPYALAKNHELVDGELVDVSGNTGAHNKVRDYLIELLRPAVRATQAGEIVSEQEFVFGENVHAPDVSFYGPEKAKLFDPRRRVQLFVPDLAIEVISESDRFLRLMQKAKNYMRSGTQETWLLSIDLREAYRYTQRGGVVLNETAEFKTDLIPGFSIRLSDLFDNA